jgi:hypothetical protein
METHSIFCTFILSFLLIYKYFYMNSLREPDSVVGTATGYGMDDRGVEVRVPVG